jgi:8-oxo-dGTP diphosphatase
MKPLRVAVGVIKNTKGQILISLRDKSLHQGGLWEFPGGKIEASETPLQALSRELKEELNIVVTTATPLITVNYQYPDLAVELNVFSVEDFSGIAESCEAQPIKWVTPIELAKHAFPAANQPIITAAQLPPYYAILDDTDESLLLVNLQKLLIRGIKLIQLRLKTLPLDKIKKLIDSAYPLCNKHSAVLMLNSDIKNTENLPCNGIHLTSRHLMSLTNRPRNFCSTSDQPTWLAASCHNLQELRHAQKIGIDFVVLAPVLVTKTHPDAVPLGWDQFSKLVDQINLPVYALGGLSESDLDIARHSGSQGIAAIRAFVEH